MTIDKQASKPTEANLLVVFSDLTEFGRMARSHSNREIFSFLSEYYEFAGRSITGGGGEIIKFMGDSILFVFPEDRVDSGVLALKDLKTTGDTWMKKRGLRCRHVIKAHFGPVVCGCVGFGKNERLDVFGDTVNTSALLKSNGLAMTPQVFRKLKPATRKHFKKHTPPITYIPVEERHRS